MTDAFDVGDNLPEIRTDVVYENDNAPYVNARDSAFEFYPGGKYQGDAVQLQDVLTVRAGATVSSDNSGPFLANLGLLEFDWFGSESGLLKLTLMPGRMKGLGARPMQKVN